MSLRKERIKQLIVLSGMSCLLAFLLASCGPPISETAGPVELALAKPSVPAVGLQAGGNLSFPNQQMLNFGTFGTIEEISVKKGDLVKQGQLLARLDNTGQRLAVDSAQYDVTKAKNALTKRICPVRGRTVYEFLNGPGVLDTLETMEVELDRASVSVASARYDEVSKELSLARDDLVRAKRVLLDSYIEVFANGLDETTLIQLSLDIEKAKIALARSKDELKKTELYAPYGGIVVDVPAKEGDMLSAANYASVPIVHIVDLNVLEVEGLFDEVDRSRVKTGDKAEITVDALPGIELMGMVKFISDIGTVRSGVAYYKFTASVEPPFNPELKHGMGVTVRIAPGPEA